MSHLKDRVVVATLLVAGAAASAAAASSGEHSSSGMRAGGGESLWTETTLCHVGCSGTYVGIFKLSSSLAGTLRSGGQTFTVTTSLSGNSFTMHVSQPGYSGVDHGTLSADGRSMSGTFTNSAGASGAWSAKLTSGTPPTLRAATPGLCAVCGSNLIKNPGAEAGGGTTSDSVVKVPDWAGSGGFTAASYAWAGGDLSATTPGPASRGKNYFYGGPAAAVSRGTQTESLPAAVTTGRLSATLSGWLGGFSSQGDDTKLSVSFLGASGQVLGTLSIGPVTEAERNGTSELLYRSATLSVPAGSSSARVTLIMTRSSGSDNDGMADNLSLVLSTGAAASSAPSGTPPPAVSPAPPAPPGSLSPPLPRPVAGSSVDVKTLHGTVLVNGKPLVAGEQIRVGATVDATQGTITITSVSPTGALQTANFAAGEFKVEQRGANGVTELTLVGGNFAVCKRTTATAAATNETIVRDLWGNGKGQFTTAGRYAAAAVRGTIWLTEDRCDGTLITVKRGTVSVVDHVHHKTVTVTTGHSYLA